MIAACRVVGHPPNLRRELGMSRYWRRTDLRELDPTTDPIAFALDIGHPLGRAVADGLGLRRCGRSVEGWSTRAILGKLLGDHAPSGAQALDAAPRCDVSVWTVVCADAECRVAVEKFVELGELVLARGPAGCANQRAYCLDDCDHQWDAEIVYEGMDWDPDEDGPASACSICGVSWESWSNRF